MLQRIEFLGVDGDGQLGRYLALAGKSLGIETIVLGEYPEGPAAQVARFHIKGDLYDPVALWELAEAVDVVSYEIEHTCARTLQELSANGVRVQPNPSTLATIQDKLLQKKALAARGIPVPRFYELPDEWTTQDLLPLIKARESIVLKTRRNGYDGKGNMIVSNEAEARSARERFAKQAVYAEEHISFERELAIVAARSVDGHVEQYDIVQTEHSDHICHVVSAPAPNLRPEVKKRAEKIAACILGSMVDGAGVFCIEAFETKDGRVLVNELAPRVHNSGHWTLDGCWVSQFEMHVRAVCGLPLPKTHRKFPCTVMVNILGRRDGSTDWPGLREAKRIPGVTIYGYGKTDRRPGHHHKLGHINAVGDDLAETRQRAMVARDLIKI